MPVDESYRNKKHSHKDEYCCVTRLNSYFCDECLPLLAEREEGGKYTHFDIDIFEFDYIEMEKKEKLLKIDVESKPGWEWINYPNEYNRPNLSFLYRKVARVNSEDDVYLLFNENNTKQIIWQTMGSIKNNYNVVCLHPKCERNTFFRLPSHRTETVNWFWGELIDYIKRMYEDKKKPVTSSLFDF